MTKLVMFASVFILALLMPLTTSSPVYFVTIRATVGDYVQLNCTTQMAAPVDWQYLPSAVETQPRNVYFNGILVNGYSKKYRMEHQTEFIYNLIIPNAALDDAGIFTCIENGGVGDTLTQVNLVVSRPQAFQMVPNNNISVKVGSEFHIECITGLEEPVDFHFYSNFNEQINMVYLYANRYVVKSFEGRVSVDVGKEGRYELIARDVTTDMSGTYECIENGGVGPGRDRVKVFVTSVNQVATGSNPQDSTTIEAADRTPSDAANATNTTIIIITVVGAVILLAAIVAVMVIKCRVLESKEKENVSYRPPDGNVQKDLLPNDTRHTSTSESSTSESSGDSATSQKLLLRFENKLSSIRDTSYCA